MKIRPLLLACFILISGGMLHLVKAQQLVQQNADTIKPLSDYQLNEYSVMKTDWANLARYHDENAKAGAPAAGENRVVFMGNSITQGWIETCPGFFEGRPYFDRGISGQTTPQMLIRFHPDVVRLKPAVVVILAGTNDIAGNTGPSTLEMIEDNIAAMVEIARANNIKVVLASVLPALDFGWNPGTKPAPRIAELNAWIQDYARKNRLVYLDYYSPMADEHMGLKSIYSEDGVHPNEKGYKVMEPLAEKAIQMALNGE